MAHNLTEVDSYDATVTVPDDGDSENANSVITPFQSLANRCKNLKGRLDGIVATLAGTAFTWTAAHLFTSALRSNVGLALYGGSDDVVYTNSSGAATPRSRATPIALFANPITAGQWLPLTTYDGIASVSADTNRVPIRLPHGASLTGVVLRVAVPSGTLTANVVRSARGVLLANAAPTVTTIGTATQGVTASAVFTVTLGVAETIDNQQNSYFLDIVSPAALTEARGALAIWADPGPRNN